jgi:hypothetical protein
MIEKEAKNEDLSTIEFENLIEIVLVVASRHTKYRN